MDSSRTIYGRYCTGVPIVKNLLFDKCFTEANSILEQAPSCLQVNGPNVQYSAILVLHCEGLRQLKMTLLFCVAHGIGAGERAGLP